MKIADFFSRQSKPEFITVVSGLPRSGTSMMMQILQAGGLPLLTDKIRVPDQNNSRGYYEHESVKELPKGEYEFLNTAQGQAVKVVSNLLKHLPSQHHYKIILMRREISEVMSSQQQMLENLKNERNYDDEKELARKYNKHITSVAKWAPKQAHFELLEMDYASVLNLPEIQIAALIDFLGVRLNKNRMLGVIDSKMRHHKFDH